MNCIPGDRICQCPWCGYGDVVLIINIYMESTLYLTEQRCRGYDQKHANKSDQAENLRTVSLDSSYAIEHDCLP
jgi:hypothetical protein